MTKATTLFDEDFEKVKKFSKEAKQVIESMTQQEVRYLVSNYYRAQRDRIRTNNQIRALEEAGSPFATIEWFSDQSAQLEKYVAQALDVYSKAHPIGRWIRTIKGCGPVLTAGFLAHLDIEKAPYAGHFWSYAGLVAKIKWNKGEKRPWNAELKRLCWLASESFVKCSGGEDPSPYGMFYKKWKAEYIRRNEAGELKERADQALAEKKYGKETEAYKAYSQGRLPPAHIQAMAQRKAVQLFLGHLHEYWYEQHYKTEAPKPYVIVHLDHRDYIPRPDQLTKSEWLEYFS